MSLTRLRQAIALTVPLARATSFGPVVIGGALAAAYVFFEGDENYIDYRILVLRIAAVAISLGAAFALDDDTEDVVGATPAPLLMRRTLRALFVAPIAAFWWFVCLGAVGDVPLQSGGPLPGGDLTLEAATLFCLALAASSAGALLASDRLGGALAAPMVLGFVAIVAALPGEYRLLVSPDQEQWQRVHETWRYLAWGGAATFLYLSLDRGRYPVRLRMKRAIGSAIARVHPGTSGPTS